MVAVYDAIDGLNLDDRRLPEQETQQCFDCNAEAYKDKLCTFAANYWTDFKSEHFDNSIMIKI